MKLSVFVSGLTWGSIWLVLLGVRYDFGLWAQLLSASHHCRGSSDVWLRMRISRLCTMSCLGFVARWSQFWGWGFAINCWRALGFNALSFLGWSHHGLLKLFLKRSWFSVIFGFSGFGCTIDVECLPSCRSIFQTCFQLRGLWCPWHAFKMSSGHKIRRIMPEIQWSCPSLFRV